METKITFEKLPDGTCVITVKGKNMHGKTYLRQEIIKESAVFDALKSCTTKRADLVDRREYNYNYIDCFIIYNE